MGVGEMSPAIQDYVKAIYFLTASAEAVSTNVLARRLGTSQPAVSKMLKLLARRGWVSHNPYRGASLTETGTAAALEVIRHHRLLECYLSEHLGFAPDEVHSQAEVLEHHISEQLEDRIAELLGHPETCPHGQPIPPKTQETTR